MSFTDTYRHEIYLSRQDRARRALFWAKVTGFVLMVTIGATLRVEPDLRRLLMNAGMDAVTKVAGLPPAVRRPAAAGPLNVTWKPHKTDNPSGTYPLSPDVKINRFAATKPPQALNLEQALDVQSALRTIQP